MVNYKPKKQIPSVSGSNSNNGSGGSGNPPQPSPWITENPPKSDSTASFVSFVEYLRWMRSPDSQYKDGTKVQILQMAAEKAKSYRPRLEELTNRTKLIAGTENTFQVKCLWRVRVGGHRGPESILLPAFDALGMPYIPSSTLRGAARTQAIRHFMAEGMTWEQATREIARYFGSLETKNESDRAGKVIFLDAYPLPPLPNQAEVLAVDMANNIWNWEGDSLNYSPNPNPFFSLKEPTFLIGLRPTANCDDNTFNKVKDWLIKGLQSGIGSQVNTGYGKLVRAGQVDQNKEFIKVSFTIEGQLIHGRQRFTQWQWNDRRQEWQTRGEAEAEVRPIAFKSMLRYWFRAFALGVLPAKEVQQWEASLFGSIKPQKQGWVIFQVVEGQKPRSVVQNKDAACLKQQGELTLSYSSEAPSERQADLAKLYKNLTWMMFHLGGIGQGARRPCYSRQNRPSGFAPWYRGSTLTPDNSELFSQLPDNPQEFQRLFRQRLQNFYAALAKIAGKQINERTPLRVGTVSPQQWSDVVDGNCQIVVCSGDEEFDKPYALAVLHDEKFKRNGNYDGNLCGTVRGGVKPSPVWIADLGNYQVVTVFGATQDPRKKYLKDLRDRSTNYAQIFPLQ